MAICQAPLPILTPHNNINQISLSEKMVMLSSFHLLWPLCKRVLWTWSGVEGGWLTLRRKVTSSTSFRKPPVYICVARVLCICVSIKGLGHLLIQFSHSVMSDSLPTHARPPSPSPTPKVCSNSCPLSQWSHPTISTSVVPFSPHLQSFPASWSFQLSQFFASGGKVLEFKLLISLWLWRFNETWQSLSLLGKFNDLTMHWVFLRGYNHWMLVWGCSIVLAKRYMNLFLFQTDFLNFTS